MLSVILLGMAAAMLVLTLFNLARGEFSYVATDGLLVVAVSVIYTANRLGFVWSASVATVGLAIGGTFLLMEESLTAVYATMTLPVLIASSLLVPWAGFVVAGLMTAGALVFGVAELSLITLFVVAVVSYLFAESIDRSYRQSRHQALHDALTGLPNRAMFVDRLSHALIRARRRDSYVAVLFMDLDNFKVINDSLGHDLGDRLLVRTGQRILECLRPEDTVARLGGDEFTVLLEDISDLGAAVGAAERISSWIRLPMVLGGHEVTVIPSTGIALASGDAVTPQNLLRNADAAMYEAKRSSADYAVFEAAMHSGALARLKLEGNLRRAIEEREFHAYYQPKLRLSDGSLVGMEALVRWGGQQGLLMPSEFVPVAEETSLIVPIGEQVLEMACQRAYDWNRNTGTGTPVNVCVNLSVRQFQNTDLVAVVRAVLEKTGLLPERLELEITESMIMEEGGRALKVLQRLRTLGVRIAVDDFGKGYSSLSYLRTLPVNALKIDRTFIEGIGRHRPDTAIVGMIVSLARTLGLEVTAEGVETAEQADYLRTLGCDFGQGYHFSKPLDGPDADRFVFGSEGPQ